MRMAAITTAQEYQAVREAIQTLSADSNAIVSFNLNGMQVTYRSDALPQLQQREKELARRLTIRNVRKRTVSDFSGGGTSSLPV